MEKCTVSADLGAFYVHALVTDSGLVQSRATCGPRARRPHPCSPPSSTENVKKFAFSIRFHI